MSKKINYWWVVATREGKRMKQEEANGLGMDIFMDGWAGARVFVSRQLAEACLYIKKSSKTIPEGIIMRIISDDAWYFAKEMFVAGKHGRKELL